MLVHVRTKNPDNDPSKIVQAFNYSQSNKLQNRKKKSSTNLLKKWKTTTTFFLHLGKYYNFKKITDDMSKNPWPQTLIIHHQQQSVSPPKLIALCVRMKPWEWSEQDKTIRDATILSPYGIFRFNVFLWNSLKSNNYTSSPSTADLGCLFVKCAHNPRDFRPLHFVSLCPVHKTWMHEIESLFGRFCRHYFPNEWIYDSGYDIGKQ